TWHFQATLLARAGDLEGYRRVCRDMLARFGDSDKAVVVQRVGTACLIAPKGIDHPASVVGMMKRVERVANWHDITLALGHYRQGQWEEAVDALATFSKVSWDYDVVALAIRAMAQHKQDQPEAARQTLQQAREGLARFALPGPGELQTIWYNWHL